MSYYENPSASYGKSFGSGYLEPVQPKLRSDLVIRKFVHKNEVSYMVKDPVERAYYQLQPIEHDILTLFDGTRTDDEVIDEFNEHHHEGIIDEEILESYKSAFREMELLEIAPQQKNLMLMERIRAQRKIKKKVTEGDIFYMTVSAWDPDRFFNRIIDHLRFFWTREFLVVSLACIALMLVINIVKWDEFQHGIIALYSFHEKSLWDILVFVFLTTFAGMIHEFAHGLTLKNYGGEVRQMGFLLFYFTPAFYVDTSDAYILPSRKERLWVTMAGTYSELMICSLAAFVWFFSVPGTVVYDLSFTVILFFGISSFFINMNPLVKLDGYYALMDTLEIPDLREESFAYVKRWIKKHLFHLQVEDTEETTRRKRRIFITYACLALLYTFTLYLLIVMWIRNIYVETFEGFAYPLLLITLFFMFRKRLRQLWDFFKFVYLDKKEVFMKQKRFILGVFIAALILLLVPLTHMKIGSSFALEPVHSTEARAETEGFLDEVMVREGDRVQQGQILAKMMNRELTQEALRVQSSIDQTTSALVQLQSVMDTADYRMKERLLEQLQEEKVELQRRLDNLTVRSPIDGTVLTPHVEEAVGTLKRRGDLICHIGNVRELKVEIPLHEYEIEDVRKGQRVLLKFGSFPAETLEGEVTGISPAGGDRVDAPEGSFSTFRVTVLLPNPDGRLVPGMRGNAKILIKRYPLLVRIVREASRGIRARIW